MSAPSSDARRRLAVVVEEARACTHCDPFFDHEPRPVFQVGAEARILIVGQAPGRKVHASGVPWDDPSGDRLRAWLGVDRDTFYDPDQIALLPMGFCYPGHGPSGDLPPRPECAPMWHPRIVAELPDDRMTVLLGAYALERYLPQRSKTLTETVSRWREHLPTFALPHPSPRNQRWLHKNPWFESDVIPALQAEVADKLVA